MKKIILITILHFLTVTLVAQQKEFGWLCGTWKLKDKNVFETWRIADDGKSLDGFSFRTKGTDTIAMEQIRVATQGGFFHYIPDVAGDQGAVDFRITKYTNDSFVAENPQHDFPKIIRYQFIKKDNGFFIEASIEGNGKVIPYSFERLK